MVHIFIYVLVIALLNSGEMCSMLPSCVRNVHDTDLVSYAPLGKVSAGPAAFECGAVTRPCSKADNSTLSLQIQRVRRLWAVEARKRPPRERALKTIEGETILGIKRWRLCSFAISSALERSGSDLSNLPQ